MAIDDNTLYGLTGAQVKELPERIEAVKGKARVLTTADYNYNSSTGTTTNPNCVALWLLDPGLYTVDSSSVMTVRTASEAANYKPGVCLVTETHSNGNKSLFCFADNGTTRVTVFAVNATSGSLQYEATNALQSYVDNRIKTNAGAPTTSTVGTVGQLLEDTTNGDLYICTAVSGSTYTWEEVGAGGGSGPTVVQTTGTSTTDVMSQNAVTSELYPQYSSNGKGVLAIGNYTTIANYGPTKIGIGQVILGNSSAYAVAINGGGSGATVNAISGLGIWAGNGGSVTGHSGIAIGSSASVSGRGGVAIGRASSATSQGEFNIGSSESDYGYNSSNYRLLTGLYDPQADHDAATKGYVDSVAPTITMTTTDPGEGVALAENNFIAVYSAS